MPKFSYRFTLADKGPSFREYCCGDNRARVDFISDSIVRVAVYKASLREKILPTFLVNPDEEMLVSGRDRLSCEGFGMFKPEICEDGGTDTVFLANGCTLKINTSNFLLSFYKSDKLLFSDRAPLSYNFSGEFGDGQLHYISREQGENIYGLGDKSGNIDKSGRAFRIEATDCMGFDASSSDPLYKHAPFYMCRNSVGTYGILYDTSDTSYFDFGKEINNYYEPYKYFKTEDNALVYYVFLGGFTEILAGLDTVCGRQAFPPKWSFDYCASTMAYTDADNSDELMNGFLDKLAELDFSCKGFYLSSGYTSIGPQRFVFNWNTDKFPSPERFIERFESEGVHLIPNIKPAFLTDHPMYEELKSRGLFVKNEDSAPFVTQFWDGLGSYLDFTNPEAFAFWQEQVTDKLLNKGIIATWNDNNEFDIKDNSSVAYGFGKGEVNAARIRNTLTYLMVAASCLAQKKEYPELRPFLSSRCSNYAIRRLAQTWSGDNRTEFQDLRYCLKIGLTLSLSGFGFYGHDLGGFTGNMPSRELLLRWLQLGVFQPRFTIHSWNRDGSATMPWSYEDIVSDVRNIFAQRKRLLPYMYSSAYFSYKNSTPLNAPLFLYYPEDDTLSSECDSFMFGRDIIVSPVLDEGKEESVITLPKGDCWYFKGRLYEGGQQLAFSLPAKSTVPFAVKAGSVIAFDEAEYGFKKENKTVFTVYPLKQGCFKAEFFDDDGISYKYLDGECTFLSFFVECDSDSVRVSYKNEGKNTVVPEIKLCEEDERELIITTEDA